MADEHVGDGKSAMLGRASTQPDVSDVGVQLFAWLSRVFRSEKNSLVIASPADVKPLS